MHLRTATPDDVPALYALWGRAFDAPLMVPVYETDDGRLDRTHVAEPQPDVRQVRALGVAPPSADEPTSGLQ
ncbi:MAG: hypothetical protein ACTMID_07585, partial [Cellulosimicrobium funkei]